MARRRRRNPLNPVAALGNLSNMAQGVDATDALAAVGGLAAATMVPGWLIKPAAGTTTLTTMQKLLKVAIAVGSALAAGMAAKSFLSAKAGKAAVIGGIAGTGVQVVNMVRPATIAQGQLMSPPGFRGYSSPIRETTTISPSTSREGETVQFIQP